ncbi:alanine:cation symporter family protein [Caldibacillus thermoamylovorans]|uniref:alanine/glycine:cation symporter family protein n=1 Tax=Caldibacillus thermoamylovorans TaxID=35841 RepID=UPI00203C6ED3|nr:alanine/glycine:cation symporter family protein [Caldibacillus thermoamylovorans]MCM3799455.1 alanine:cation symporter family protein [Caldibacillus thermoamylovorans]
MADFINTLYSWLWSTPMIVFCIAAGVIFTLMTKFAQVRLIRDMIKQMFKGKSSKSGISSFQALSIALSGRVGTGNIAGVATAIAYGGPGAVFWMWLIAFFGAATAYVESTLGQIYKEKVDGEYRGGPAYYIEKGLNRRWAGMIFGVAGLLAMAVLMPGVQSNAISAGFDNAFSISPWITGIFLAVLLGVIIIGGVKPIANVAQLVVPFMALGYILVALVIIFMNIEAVPGVFKLIFTSAFGADQLFGGILGSAIAWGVKRGIYSNEAGQGTGPHAASAAEVSHPAKQGLVQAFSIYIDTLLVCSATAFMILFTGSYNVYESDQSTLIVNNIGDSVEVGTAYTQMAVDSQLPGFGSPFVAIALFFFAFTTIMAYYYIAESNVVYLFKGRNLKIPMMILKIAMIAATFYGTVRTSTLAWTLGDIGLGFMVWTNLIGLVFLYKPAIQALKDYEEQKKQGLDPEYNSTKLGVKNADFWEDGYKKEEAV